MKFVACIFLAVLLVGVHGWDDSDEECVKELSLDKATIKAISDKDKYPEDNAVFNNFLACSGKKEKVIKDGELDWKKIEELFDTEMEKEIEKSPTLESVLTAAILDETLEKCREQKIHGDSDGQTLATLYNCLMSVLTEAERR